MRTYELVFSGFSEIVTTAGDESDAIVKCGLGQPYSIIEIKRNDDEIKLIKRINELEKKVERLQEKIDDSDSHRDE